MLYGIEVAQVEWTSEHSLSTPSVDAAPPSPEEITEAIQSLSSLELLKLERYARYRIRGLGRKADGRDHEDLMKDAIVATLAGDRKWNRNVVGLVVHLIGAMRSISSHWREKMSFESAAFRAEPSKDSLDTEAFELTVLPSSAPDAERVLEAKEEVASIRDYFQKDLEVMSVLEAFAKGWEGGDIRSHFQWSQTRYETIMKRMRRGLAARARLHQLPEAGVRRQYES